MHPAKAKGAAALHRAAHTLRGAAPQRPTEILALSRSRDEGEIGGDRGRSDRDRIEIARFARSPDGMDGDGDRCATSRRELPSANSLFDCFMLTGATDPVPGSAGTLAPGTLRSAKDEPGHPKPGNQTYVEIVVEK